MNTRELSKKTACMFSHRFWYLLAAFALFFAGAAQGGTLYVTDGRNLYSVTAENLLEYESPAGCDGLALSPDPSSFLYCASSGVRQYDRINGFLHALSPTEGIARFVTLIDGDADRGLAYDMFSGLLFGTDNRSFGTIDPETGEFERLADPPGDTEPESLAADPFRGAIYGLGTNEQLVVYDIATGEWSDLGDTGVDQGNQGGLAYDPVADLLYFLENDGVLWSIDPMNLETLEVARFEDFGPFAGLAYVPEYPVPDIKVNGSDGPVTIWRFQRVSVTVSLDAGELANSSDVEEWISVDRPDGLYHYDFDSDQWLPGPGVSAVGPLQDRLETPIFDGRQPRGSYTLNYHIDLVVNGEQDAGFSDSVSLRVR